MPDSLRLFATLLVFAAPAGFGLACSASTGPATSASVASATSASTGSATSASTGSATSASVGLGGTTSSESIELGRSYVLHSEILGQDRRINIFLPPGYGDEADRFPVLYLLDGGVEEDFVHISGIAALGAEWRGIRRFVLVGIEGVDRYHDLVPPSTVESDKERIPTSGGSAKFRDFLARELKPFVEANFRVTGETALIGESAAGLFVVETFLVQPGLFQAYAAISPSLWWDNQSLAKSAAERLESAASRNTRLFLTIADEGGAMRDGVDRVVAALSKQAPSRVEWRFLHLEDETHATTFHPAALAAVRWLFATP